MKYLWLVIIISSTSVFLTFQNCGKAKFQTDSTANSQDLNNGSGNLDGSDPDADGDGLTDEKENELGTNPSKEDTDGDGLKDGQEVNTYHTNPKKKDTDGGGINDGAEVNRGTDPLDAKDDKPEDNSNKDTDNDGLKDKQEEQLGTDKNNADTDGDGLKDGEEVNTYKTNPKDPDTDDGGIKDGAEVTRGTDPLDDKDDQPESSLDPDKDGLTNAEEQVAGTNPNDADSDDDGLKDGEEVKTHKTNPNKKDTDNGGVNDGDEVSRGTDPLDKKDDMPIDVTKDSDSDGLTDVVEKEIGTNPLKPDTDKDGLKDGAEVNMYGTDPLDPDMDDGGATDGAEIAHGTNPKNNPKDDFAEEVKDSDNDGLTDKEELQLKTDPNNPDSDGDKLTDGSEVKTHKTNPLDPDTDDGGMNDGYEVVKGKNPLDPKDDIDPNPNKDTDGDGLIDTKENEIGTDPNKADTDGDGLSDGAEVFSHRTDPLKADTDNGGINDGDEVGRGTNPLDAKDDMPVTPCKEETTFSLWLDPKNTKDASKATYVGDIEPFSGDITSVQNYGYSSASAHPKFGPQPKANIFNAFFYEGKDGLNLMMFAGQDEIGDNRWEPVSYNVSVDGNGLADKVKISDDGKELKQVEAQGNKKIYNIRSKYINNTDGGVIGPFVTNHFMAHYEFKNTEEWNEAFFVSKNQKFSLGKKGEVTHFMVGKHKKMNCDDKKIRVVLKKTPAPISKETDGEFIFDIKPDTQNYKAECRLDNQTFVSCSENSSLIYKNLGAGKHKFLIRVLDGSAAQTEVEFIWEVVKPTPPSVVYGPWSEWSTLSQCVDGLKKEHRSREVCTINNDSSSKDKSCRTEEDQRVVKCSTPPIGDGWGPWSEWQIGKCVDGLQKDIRTRMCLSTQKPLPEICTRVKVNCGANPNHECCGSTTTCSGPSQEVRTQKCQISCPMYMPPRCADDEKLIIEKNDKGCSVPRCVPDETKARKWVNANIGESQESACARANMVPSDDMGLGVCASGEDRPAGVTTIKYAYGTWGNNQKGGIQVVGKYCYQPGQKRDEDKTDITVAFLCKPGVVVVQEAANRWCHMSDVAGKVILGYKDNGAIHKPGCYYNAGGASTFYEVGKVLKHDGHYIRCDSAPKSQFPVPDKNCAKTPATTTTHSNTNSGGNSSFSGNGGGGGNNNFSGGGVTSHGQATPGGAAGGYTGGTGNWGSSKTPSKK